MRILCSTAMFYIVAPVLSKQCQATPYPYINYSMRQEQAWNYLILVSIPLIAQRPHVRASRYNKWNSLNHKLLETTHLAFPFSCKMMMNFVTLQAYFFSTFEQNNGVLPWHFERLCYWTINLLECKDSFSHINIIKPNVSSEITICWTKKTLCLKLYFY